MIFHKMRKQQDTKSFTSGERASLEQYLLEIGKEKRLSDQEEALLTSQIRQGDKAAINKLAQGNLHLAVSIAKQYRGKGLTLQDLINEGNIGLLKAAEKYDERHGVKFSTYAARWIRQSILQALSSKGNIVRQSAREAGAASRINKERWHFEQENERRPSVNELAERTDMPEEQVANSIKNMTRPISIDAPFTPAGHAGLLDVLPDDSTLQTDKPLEQTTLRENLPNALAHLNERERTVLEMSFGLSRTEMTFAEIGKALGLARERVRQIRKTALRKLKRDTNNKFLKAYLRPQQ